MIGDCYVYLITNVIDNSVYIGKSIDPEKRFKNHLLAAQKGNIGLPHFYNAIRRYGSESFCMKVCAQFKTEDEAFEHERLLIAEFRARGINVYNVSAGGRGGTRYSQDQRRAHSEIQRAWSQTQDARAKNSAAQSQLNVRQAKSIAMKERWESDVDLRERHHQSITTPDILEHQSERQSNAWKDPIQRQRLLEGMHRPDVKRARKERLSHEGNPRAKLNWEVVRQIRLLFNTHNSMEQLMTEFPHISYATLRRVVTNRAWIK